MSFPKKEISLLIAGIGGQGVRFLARMFSVLLHSEGYYVSSFSSYGAEVRNTPITASITISKSPILSPYRLVHDLIIIMDKRVVNQVTKYSNKNTTIISVFNTESKEMRLPCKRILTIPLLSILSKNNLEKYLNTAILGLLASLFTLPLDKCIRTTMESVRDKEANIRALEIGYKIGSKIKLSLKDIIL